MSGAHITLLIVTPVAITIGRVLETIAYSLLLLVVEHSAAAYAFCEPCFRRLCGVPQPSLRLDRRTILAWRVICGFSFLLMLGGAFALVLLLLIVAAGSTLWYERRLRRSGGTTEAKALQALSEAEDRAGLGVEEEDVSTERARVERIRTATARAGGKAREGDVGDALAGESAVVIQRLRKVFPPRGKAGPKIAVVDLSLAIHKVSATSAHEAESSPHFAPPKH